MLVLALCVGIATPPVPKKPWHAPITSRFSSKQKAIQYQEMHPARAFRTAVETLQTAQNETIETKKAAYIISNTIQTIGDIVFAQSTYGPKVHIPEDLKRYANQMLNNILMAAFGKQDHQFAHDLIVAIHGDKKDPQLARRLGEAVERMNKENAHTQFAKHLMGLEAGLEYFYKEYYAAKLPSRAKYHRNVAIGALATTIAGLVASVALGATIIALPAAIGLAMTTLGGPGYVAYSSYSDHKKQMKLEQYGHADVDALFDHILQNLQQLTHDITILRKKVKQ